MDHVIVTLASGQKVVGDYRFRVVQAEFQHEVARLTVPNSPAMLSLFSRKEPYPLSVVWHGLPSLGEFWGYIVYVEPRGSLMDVVCSGPTYRLGTSGYAVFKNTTVPFMLRRIVDGVKLRLDAGPHVQLLTLAQNGKSSWAFMVDAVQRIGFTLYPLGGRIVAHDRSLGVAQQLSTVRDLQRGANLGEDWTSTAGTSSPNGGELAIRHAHSVDPRRMTAVFAKNKADSKPSLGPIVHTPAFVRTQPVAGGAVGDVQAHLDAEALNNRLYIEASVTVTANPRLRPGSIVRVIGQSALDDGLWYVKTACHERTSTHLSLGRDSVGSTGIGPGPVHAAEPRVPAPKLVNNAWVAA